MMLKQPIQNKQINSYVQIITAHHTLMFVARLKDNLALSLSYLHPLETQIKCFSLTCQRCYTDKITSGYVRTP